MSAYDVFLSYNHDDEHAVKTIAQRLRQERGISVFLDQWNLIPGRPWQEDVEAALDDSETVAVFIGPSGISPWHNEEMRAALDRAVRARDEARVIPIWLPGATETAVSGFLARRVWVDFRSGLDDEQALARLVAGIKGEAIVSGVYELPDEPVPYRGLLYFRTEDARFFFGREDDCDRLIEKLRQHSFVALVGASGSGKSSLVRAGLLPALADNALPDSRDWLPLVFTPSSDPLHALTVQLATLVPLSERLEITDKLAERLLGRDDGLRTAVATLLADQPHSVLLVIDQFEELFTLCQEGPERCRVQIRHFIANLVDAVRYSQGAIRIVIILRADFLDRCLTFPELKELLQDHQVLLGALTEEALRNAVARPAQAVGTFFEKGLVSMILRDVQAQPGALPLLQHALYELWRARRGPWLTLDAYEVSGGVKGALQRRAQATYEALPPEQQPIACNIFLRLTALGEGVSDTRRRVNRVELYPTGIEATQIDAALQALSGPGARLIIADEQTVEIAHEALIQKWDMLRAWLEKDREALRIHRRLTEAAIEWEGKKRDTSYLYRGVRLVEVEEWSNTHTESLNQLEHAFLDASLAQRDLEAQETERQQQEKLEQAQRLAEEQQKRAEEAEARRRAEEARAYEAEAREQAQRKSAIRLRWLVVILTVIAAAAPVLWIRQLILKTLARGPVVYMEASSAIIGSDANPKSSDWPSHTVAIPAFYIEKHEVTNQQYELCVTADVCRPPQDRSLYETAGRSDVPVVGVSAYQADDYCRWLGRRLPTELEWERAARGSDGRKWPWGEVDPDPTRLNLRFGQEEDLRDSAPVGSYRLGDTPDEVTDLAGNVWEWTVTPNLEYPYDADPAWKTRLILWVENTALIIRGCSYNCTPTSLPRITVRVPMSPAQVKQDVGFRCVRDTR